MVDFFDNYDEIEFLESEIEDDDPDAPVGSLFDVVEGKVCPVAQKTQPAPAETVVEETVPAGEEQAPVVQEVAAVEEEPVSVEEPAPAPVAEVAVEEPAPAVEEQPAEEPVAAVQTPSEPAAADDASAYGTELPIGIYVPSAVGSEPAPAEPAPVEEAAVEEPAPVVEEPAPAPAPVEEQVAEEPAPAPAPKKKKTATKAARTTIQPAADEGNIWGAAVISGAPKKKAVSEEEKPSAIAEETPAASSESEKSKEETEVAKDKAPAKEAKKPAAKTAAKPAAKTTAKPAAKPAAKTAAKPAAKTEAPAKTAPKKPAAAKETAKPATKPATKPENEEQIIEAGDASAPHGKFVIKKTDKGNFVYKLYSSNHKVVAIGAEPYSSLSACKSGIASVRNNAATAPIEDQTLQKWEELKFPKWQIYTDKKGEIRLRLLASNGNIVATTNDGYLSKEAAKKGIAAIGRAAKGSDIVRNDNLW